MYKTQVRNILASETEDEYTMTLESLKDTWTQAFRDYFYSSLEGRNRRILMSYRGHLHTCNYNADSVTTDNSESMNAVVKRFQNFSEVSIDRMVHAMPRLWNNCGLQDTYRLEMYRQGNFGIRPKPKIFIGHRSRRLV